jgi:hypothetical protein
MIADLRPGDPREPQDLGGTVPVLHDRPHGALRRHRRDFLAADGRVLPFRSHDRRFPGLLMHGPLDRT